MDEVAAREVESDTKRRVEKLGYCNHWVECRMQDLQLGDVFRMFEPWGSPVWSGAGKTEWTVVRSPGFVDSKVMSVGAE